ncbi:Peptidase family M49, putative [Angomonas deanei]|uniref:Peptidase family M49, putative n=1 Tax=Angomonas deanei TaxID=59799 RepID=A0A7G2CRQ4_9TRYP|nr:Peptidase family M49, putative [Angomonas deanei]
MSVNVGIHELLGHGTGKLLCENADGTFNFDKNTVIDPISGELVSSWYKPGETWGSVFGGISSSYEECRAEAVSLYLSVQSDILNLFGKHSEQEKEDTVYICWLNMVRAGLVGLEFYTPETSQWRQAHMRARFAILQVLLQGERPLVTITPHDKDGLRIELDKKRIATDGVAAIGTLLLNLNVNKATANAARGIAYYESLTAVNDTFVDYRKIVMEKRKPRKQYVQPHASLGADGEVRVREFDGSVEGVLESFVLRHKEMPL